MAVINRRERRTVHPSLQALTSAALALPGLAATPARAADDGLSFQYSHYEETKRQLYNTTSRLRPIQVESLVGDGSVSLSDRLKFAFNYVQDTWGGATPVATAPLAFSGNRLNQTVSGASPYIQNSNVFFDKNLVPLSLDPVTGEFYKNSRLVHTLASASPETRRQGSFQLGYDWDEAELEIGGGVSVEHDYESRFGSVNGRWDLNQKQTTLHAGVTYTNSSTSALLDHDAQPYIETQASASRIERLGNGGRRLLGSRQDWSGHWGITQVIDKQSLIEADFSYTHSGGYMSNPYKVVEVAFIDPAQTPGSSGELIGDVRALLEKRPTHRNQWNGSLRYALHVEPLDAAMHLGYTFFSDDWGITAHTFEADWSQPLGDGWIITPRVRYYSQDAADFYQPYLVSRQAASKFVTGADGNTRVVPFDAKLLPRHYSSDHRLSAFGAVSGGLIVGKQLGKGVNLEAGAEYYTHQGGLHLGGTGEGAYANFDYWTVNATLKLDLAALSSPSDSDSEDPHAGHAMMHGGHAGHGVHGPAGVMFDHMLGKTGEWMIGYRYMYAHQQGDMLHGLDRVSDSTLLDSGCRGHTCYVTPSEMTMHMHMFDIMYAPTDWLTLMLMPQFMDMSMSMRPIAGAPTVNGTADPGTQAAVFHSQHEHITGGIGDTGLYALFRLFDEGMHHMHVTLGISAPTGDSAIRLRNSHQQSLGFIHYGMQLGSGTWDFKPSLTYTGQLNEWSWGAQVSGTHRLEDRNDAGFAFGDVFQSTAWASYNPLDWLTASVRGLYTMQGTIQGAYRGTYRPIGPMDDPSSYGGHYWDVGFGVSAVIPSGALKGNRVSFEWLQPVHDEVNGYQLPRQGALSASWSFAF